MLELYLAGRYQGRAHTDRKGILLTRQMATRIFQSMTTDQLLGMIEDHAKVAFKEGKTSKSDPDKSRKHSITRYKLFCQIKKEVDPYAEPA